MMMKNHIVSLVLSVFLLTGCGGQANNKAKTEVPVFPRVERPVTITDPQLMADFLTQHYWDKFDFTDTAFVAYPEVLEQALVDYFVVAPYASGDLGPQSMAKLIQQAQADTAIYRIFVERSEHYLWDPNSPYRNEGLFIPVLENMLASDKIDQATRIRSEYRLELARKNRPGMVANDFTYTLESGRTGKMSQLKAEYLLLFFNNPGCTACAEIIEHIRNSPIMNKLEAEERLTVLAVYPDEDLAEWRNYLSKMPREWINGYDPGTVIKGENLYDLKAIPTLYLLDKDKKVLLKDPTIAEVEGFLQQQSQ